uniref:Uncharacterized protein n=1 Tax=Opuntia streptacantha TaxID=393608 RepID=A0A7C9E7N7_OPUST
MFPMDAIAETVEAFPPSTRINALELLLAPSLTSFEFDCHSLQRPRQYASLNGFEPCHLCQTSDSTSSKPGASSVNPPVLPWWNPNACCCTLRNPSKDQTEDN